ncbi:MAG TPA: cache domain-containing protein [Geomonas sp.]
MPAPRFSIRQKLTLGSLLPLFVAILFCSLTGIYIITTRINVLAQEKVRTDLNSAREVYANEIGHIRDVVRFSASMPLAAQALAGHDRAAMAPFLSALRRNEQLDILTMVDRRGRVMFRAGNPEVFGDRHGDDLLVTRALRGEVMAGSTIFRPDRLLLEGRQLARQSVIQVIPTQRARPGTKKVERSGMLLVAAAPVRNRRGEIVGALYGGVLLNGNNAVVDKIKRIVYDGVQFAGEDVGTATIFLDDTRISTNVQTRDGKRAIGTRLSAEVYNRVIFNREKWVDRAFVVNDWYFSAYEPILGLDGAAIGSLYVGMREQPNTALKKKVNLLFGGVLLVGSLFGLAVSGFTGSHLSRPIRELQMLVHRFSAGERGLRIVPKTSDEIGELAREFNAMTGTLMQREEAIQELNRSLGLKVQERTAELEAKNLLLTKTLQELVRAEKLAAVGELAAGVAHEINNPMAIIRGNAEILLMELPPDHASREEAEIIAQEVGRVEGIVGNLLSFARQQRKAVKRVAMDRTLEEILRQVGHQVPLDGIELRRQLTLGDSEIEGDENQLRQVFTNLIVNAVQSMENGGTLTVRSVCDPGTGACRVEIGDTGNGIEPEQIKDIFTPFFTTKQSGTGLGLSVSYGIVENHGGTIAVTSAPGSGSLFVVTLPRGQSAV